MGGTIILISVLVTCLFFVGRYPRIIPVLFLTLGFGIIGFLDDYLKVVLKRSDGLLPKQKLFCQLAVTTVFVVYLIFKDESGLTMVLPFTDYVLDIKWITVPLAYFAILGTDNGVNFTDGLDGLASSVTAVVAVFFTIASLALGGGIEPVTAAVAGALLGFLLFNVHPAQVFMGDTGSLALGGFVAGSAYMLRMPWIILVVGLIYLIEVLFPLSFRSLISKKTGGKRFLQDGAYSPSFELCGWSGRQGSLPYFPLLPCCSVAGLAYSINSGGHDCHGFERKRVLVFGTERAILEPLNFLETWEASLFSTTEMKKTDPAGGEKPPERRAQGRGLYRNLRRKRSINSRCLLSRCSHGPSAVLHFKEKGLKIWGARWSWLRFGKGDVLAITGTNGKRQPPAFYHGACEKLHFVVGNIGNPYTEAVEQMNEDSVTVAEISSFQLETIEHFHPGKVSAIWNIADHLNRHHTMEEYIR